MWGEYASWTNTFQKNAASTRPLDEYPLNMGQVFLLPIDEYPVRNVGQIVVVLRVFVKSIRIRAECEKVNSNSRESHFVPAVYLIGQYLLVNVILVHVYATGDGVVVYCNIVYRVYCRR